MSDTITITRTALPPSMQDDTEMLRHLLREVAERAGCDPDSVRNVRTEMKIGDIEMLVAYAEADRRGSGTGEDTPHD